MEDYTMEQTIDFVLSKLDELNKKYTLNQNYVFNSIEDALKEIDNKHLTEQFMKVKSGDKLKVINSIVSHLHPYFNDGDIIEIKKVDKNIERLQYWINKDEGLYEYMYPEEFKGVMLIVD